MFIFNRTIITCFDKKEEYKECITQFKSGSLRGYNFDLIKLRKYFNIDLSIKIDKLTAIKKQKNKFIEDEN